MQVYNKKVYPKKKTFSAKKIMTQKGIVSINMR